MKKAYTAIAFFFIALVTAATWTPEAGAWSSFSRCSSCHPFDDQTPQTHTAHTNLGLRCNGCHVDIPGNPHKAGISCSDCHSGIADTPKMSTCGACHLKRGVAIHHINSEQTCGGCHGSTPDSENIEVPGYAGLGLEPCSDNLDNDGDLHYDDQDPDCAPPTECGNGVMETGEECDDGNTENCDGCSTICTVEENCNDGDACNGDETCDPATGCQAGTPLSCDDGNLCNGKETCDPAAGCAGGEPLNCGDGNFCNGDETCDAIRGCLPGSNPCRSGTTCNENTDSCDTCVTDADCDNRVFCDGAETCVGGQCQIGSVPCDSATQNCNEVNDTCEDLPKGCTADAECDNKNVCDGAETCNKETGSCMDGTPLICDDGNYCTGTESCDPARGCSSSGNPCKDGETCNETNNRCDPAPECATNDDCDNGLFCDGAETCSDGQCQKGTPVNCSDGVDCTDDVCDEAIDVCVNLPKDSRCDDGMFCTGKESCNAITGCSSSGNPCGTDETCDDATDTCDSITPETPDISVDRISATKGIRRCRNNGVKIGILLGNPGDRPVEGTVSLLKDGESVHVWKDINIIRGKGKGMTLEYRYQLTPSDDAASIGWKAIVDVADDPDTSNNTSETRRTRISECGKATRGSELLTAAPEAVTETVNDVSTDDGSADDKSTDD